MASTKEIKGFGVQEDGARQGKEIGSNLQQEQFQKLISEVEDYAIILLSPDGTIITWNRGAEKIKGYLANEIVGRNYKVFYAKEDRDSLLPDTLLTTARNTGKAVHEGWRVRKDGTRFWGNITITSIHNDAGEIAGYLKVTRDLTERKIAEDNYSNYVEELKTKNEELKQSEERYHKMVSEVTDYVIILLDKNGKVLDWNKGAERVKGYKADEILGKSFRLFYPKEDKDSNLPESLLRKAVKDGSTIHEGWRIRKDGTRFWGSVALTALHSDNGDILGFSKVTRDLTDRKIADDKLNNQADELKFKNGELQKSEERYHRLIAEVQDYAIILLDKNGIIQNWNAGAELIKGYKNNEIVGKSFKEFYPESDRQAGLPHNLLMEAVEKGKVVHEGWRVRKDGSRFWGYVVITALHDDKNEIIGFSKVTRDLTSQKHADDQLKLNAAELSRKNKFLEQLNEEVNSFAYVASHDLKEPLRKIRTFTSRILEATDLDAVKALTEKINNSALRMQRLMDDLMSYSQVTSDTSGFGQVDINEIVESVKSDLEIIISEKKATIEINKLPTIVAVSFQTQQLFLNLIQNSLKFSNPDRFPIIKISAARILGKNIPLGLVNDLNEYIKISLSDNGIGFPASDSKKIFDVFQRLHSRTEFAGTGIGLAIVKKVMDNHRGFVVADGRPGEGATFHIYFPLCQ
ncbi:MAG: PAS domain S-box protein [Chryseolinea sp.]